MNPLSIVGGAIQLGSALFGALSRRKLAKQQAAMAAKINPVRKMYNTSPYALENKAIAENAANGRMAGAESAEQGILSSQANAINAAQRNATSSADALAVAAGSQGAATDAQVNLADMEARYAQQAQQQVMGANDALTNEERMKYQDQLDYYNDLSAQKNALQYASYANRAGSNQALSNGGMIAGNALMGVKKGANGKNDWSTLFQG